MGHSKMPTQLEIHAAKAKKIAVAEEFLCIHRSWSPVGKIKCGCSTSPDVFTCADPWVLAGYCVPKDPAPGMFPPDGPIVLEDGTNLRPADERRAVYNTWPLRDGETPKIWDVPVCSTCPKRLEPPPHIGRLQRLGIVGNYNRETGHCDVLHVMPALGVKPNRIVINGCKLECVVTVSRDKPLSDLVDATNCSLLIVYGQAANIHAVKECLARQLLVQSLLKVWMVAQDSRQKPEPIPNVWYDLPADLADDLDQRTKAAYETAFARIIGD